jgi:creatinine amidohydrolase
MDAKYAPEGRHVYFCDEVYAKAQGDFDKWLVDHGYPSSSHAGIPDTSTMLYLGGDKGWVRKELIPTAEGDPVPPAGQRGRGRGQADPNAPPRKNNGISGDARRSTATLGKQAFDIKIDYAVKQIQGFLANQPKATAQQ